MLTSPFFLLNSGTLLSQPWSLVLSLAFTLAWLDLTTDYSQLSSSAYVPNCIKVCVAGLSLGVLALTRPLTAVGISIPFFIHGVMLIWRGDKVIRRQILIIGLIAGTIGSVLPLWQFILTGNALQNLYTLWWQYDQIGFGAGVGTQPGGHNLFWSINNLVLSLMSGSNDLFGWAGFSWLFIPFGVWAVRDNLLVKPLIGVPAGLALIYTIYWISPNRYGPRYYYESLSILCLLTAVGITWLTSYFQKPRLSHRLRMVAPCLALLLVLYNLVIYLPARLDSMHYLNEINRAKQLPFQVDKVQLLAPAVVIVHAQSWKDCACLLPLQQGFLKDTVGKLEERQDDQQTRRKRIAKPDARSNFWSAVPGVVRQLASVPSVLGLQHNR